VVSLHQSAFSEQQPSEASRAGAGRLSGWSGQPLHGPWGSSPQIRSAIHDRGGSVGCSSPRCRGPEHSGYRRTAFGYQPARQGASKPQPVCITRPRQRIT
jgi:hypothetical protein